MSGWGMPDWVNEPLSWIGMSWPEGDPVGLKMMSDDWLKYSGALWGHQRSGDITTEDMLKYNSGSIEKFGDWWNREYGPREFLDVAQTRAENMAAGLRAAAAKVAIDQGVWTAELYALVLTSVYAGAAVATGRLTAAAGVAARNTAKQKTKQSLEAWVVGKLIRLAVGVAIWKLFLEPFLWPYEDPFEKHNIEPCKLDPKKYYTINDMTLVGPVEDDRTRGTVAMIAQNNSADGTSEVMLHGVLRKVPGRDGYEKVWQDVRRSMGLPDGYWHGGHAFPSEFGGAAAGIRLVPESANLQYQKAIEKRGRELIEMAGPDGSVELVVKSTSHPADAWIESRGPSAKSGYNLLNRIDYTMVVCQPDEEGKRVPVHWEDYWVHMDKPQPDGRPGLVTAKLPPGAPLDLNKP